MFPNNDSFRQSDDDTKAAEVHTKASGRVAAAGTVLEEIQAAPDQRIPEEILASAECVAVVPSLLNGGFVVGGRYGKGVASCRTEKGWSAPAFFIIGGGSFGLQIGGQATDVVMLIMNKNGMDHLLSSQFKLGADASAAAGPVGRHASADTDWKMRAEVLTYSRSRGLFAGLELSGAVIKQDKEQHARILRPHGALPHVSQGRNRSPQSRVPLLEHARQVGPASGKV